MNLGAALISSLLELFYLITEFYIYILIVGAVMSWLIAFEVINTRSQFVQSLGKFIARVTDPPLKYIRRLLPPAGGIDLSPLILIFIIWFLRRFIVHLVIG